MFKNVVTALAEARDITLYLSPLMKHFLQVSFNKTICQFIKF